MYVGKRNACFWIYSLHDIFPGQVSMAIPDLTSYVVLNPKLAGLSQQLQLARYIYLWFSQVDPSHATFLHLQKVGVALCNCTFMEDSGLDGSGILTSLFFLVADLCLSQWSVQFEKLSLLWLIEV